jgi:hypothetical protein
MATSEDSTEGMTWDGYTDYQQVAGRVASEIHDATAAAAMLQRIDVEGGQVQPREMAEASSRILSAAMLIEGQLDEYSEYNDDYEEILEDWKGDDGYIKRFRRTDFYGEVPEWLFEFVGQINRAGLILGYLKAGREEEVKDEGDSADSEVKQVIEEMTV